MQNKIIIKGARVHNLKNINLEIPKNKLVVITGLSGSGKSSLAFDTIYAEGQRRYVESLSTHGQHFLDLIDKPDVDQIIGLSPTVAIKQRNASYNPRSTVGTMTEIYDYIRLLYARANQINRNNSKIPQLEPINFSFNSPYGACPACNGLGYKLKIIPDLILNKNLTIAQGAIIPLNKIGMAKQDYLEKINKALKTYKFNINTYLKDLNQKQLNFLLYGENNFNGIIKDLEDKHQQTDSDFIRNEIEKYMDTLVCPVCNGGRLNKQALQVKVNGLSIDKLVNMSIDKTYKFFEQFSKKNKNLTFVKIILPIIKEIKKRLKSLNDIGLSYLTLDRQINTLSNGEDQRIRLSKQLNLELNGIIYILDEPSIGLHQRDVDKLIISLKKLRDFGNTVIVVEHDKEIILNSDWIIEIGPGAGDNGGKIITQGSLKQIKKSPNSLIGSYLTRKKESFIIQKNRIKNNKSLIIKGAKEHNLKNLTVEFPLGKFIVITGVSGSGKSTLVGDILAPALRRYFYHTKIKPGAYKKIEGIENIDKVVVVDQSPIGKTPHSNPATYTGIFSQIRELFAKLPESRKRDYDPGKFSFNLAGGRCEKCQGQGLVKINMKFLPDVYVKCDACQGLRYKKEILDIYYKGKNIADILEMTIKQAYDFFKDSNTEVSFLKKLKILNDIGLGYIKLGQPATTFSGGEAQRIKLATELGRKTSHRALYILDEPTVGLHFIDIKNLLKILQKLVLIGNTVLIVEHNLDVIKLADWIIDLGLESGENGGRIVDVGIPKKIAYNKKSWTGKYLRKELY